MHQKGWRLTHDEVEAWIAELLGADMLVIAPVERSGNFQFLPLSHVDELVLPPSRTQWSPKEFFLPRTETLYSYDLSKDGLGMEDPVPDETPRVLFGVRPCDVVGVRRLVDVFCQGEVVDPLVTQRWETTTIVSLACSDVEEACFCTAVGGSPNGTEDVDVQLVFVDGVFLVSALSQKGEYLIGDEAEKWSPAKDEDWQSVQGQAQRLEKEIRDRYGADLTGVDAALEKQFDHELWEEQSEMCVACSICSFVCPSCSCFDVYHENNALEGSARRSWDSCSFELFTKHASGHNPRDGGGARLRQRVLHKFAYKDQKHPQMTRCVGCGRCTTLCPAGIHIYHIVEKLLTTSHEDSS